MNNKFINIYTIGYYGPIILFATITIYIILPLLASITNITNITTITTTTNHILYIIFINAISIELNAILKLLIKQPRPNRSKKININDVKQSKTYGMPSGHAQIVANNLVYLSMLANNKIITTISSIIALLTLYQRYVFRMHTKSQLAYGALLGGTTGYIFFKLYSYVENREDKLITSTASQSII
tara:strand:+ start:104 stop:658 length:555 start_codon:yes stop_codon:yes gene_type:complete